MSERIRRAHEPKLAALAQLDAGRLSERGRQRVLRHLQRCDTCSEALAGIRRFQRLAADVAAARPPALDWTRLEATALRTTPRPPASDRAFSLIAPLLAAAALMLAVFAWQRIAIEGPTARAPRRHQLASRPIRVEVSALVGEVQARLPGGRVEPLTLDSHPQAGWTIEPAADGEAHLVLADTARVLVASDSALRLVRLDHDDVELALERGRTVSKVRALGDRHYEVTAQGYRAQVRGTLFEVRAELAGTAVRVDEGHVVVLSANGVCAADLMAPQTWASAPELSAARRRDHSPLRAARDRAPADSASLVVPPIHGVVGWRIGADVLPASAELRMRVPPGSGELSAELVDGRLVPTSFRIDPLGTRFDPSWLRLPALPSAAPSGRGTPGQLDAAAAAAIIRSAQPALQRCYERSLRTTDLAGIVKLTLTLALDGAGRVRGSELSATTPVPAELTDCVREATRGLVFPAPGGAGIRFAAPLRFRSR